MNLRSKIGALGRRIQLTTYWAIGCLPIQGIKRPVFIIGCGRSGTTILGTSLSKHRQVTYLNEPRHLWYSAYPETDVWTRKADSRHGQLALKPEDAEPNRSRKLRRLFRFETMIRRRPVLIEKLPTNSFRLEFIRRIFPDARFIHIYRNGMEVARSIDKLSSRGRWFGTETYKWNKLVEYARNKDGQSDLSSLCTTSFDKGLLEWRLSTEAVIAFARHLSEDAFFEIKYDDLINHPSDAIAQVLEFAGLGDDSQVNKFVAENIVRKTSTLGQCELSEKDKLLGGKLLPLSMDLERGLVNRV